MPRNIRLGPRIALGVVILGLILGGTAARHSAAQIPPQVPPPMPPSATAPTADPKDSRIELPQVPLETRSEVHPSLPDAGTSAELPVPNLHKSVPTPASETTISVNDVPSTVVSDFIPGDTDDPEKVATAFFQHNQQLAEAHLKALKDEAEKLKARLSKVEAGAKRWERLLAALKQSQSPSAAEPPVVPADKSSAAQQKPWSSEAREIERQLARTEGALSESATSRDPAAPLTLPRAPRAAFASHRARRARKSAPAGPIR